MREYSAVYGKIFNEHKENQNYCFIKNEQQARKTVTAPRKDRKMTLPFEEELKAGNGVSQG